MIIMQFPNDIMLGKNGSQFAVLKATGNSVEFGNGSDDCYYLWHDGRKWVLNTSGFGAEHGAWGYRLCGDGEAQPVQCRKMLRGIAIDGKGVWLTPEEVRKLCFFYTLKDGAYIAVLAEDSPGTGWEILTMDVMNGLGAAVLYPNPDGTFTLSDGLYAV